MGSFFFGFLPRTAPLQCILILLAGLHAAAVLIGCGNASTERVPAARSAGPGSATYGVESCDPDFVDERNRLVSRINLLFESVQIERASSKLGRPAEAEPPPHARRAAVEDLARDVQDFLAHSGEVRCVANVRRCRREFESDSQCLLHPERVEDVAERLDRGPLDRALESIRVVLAERRRQERSFAWDVDENGVPR